MGGLDDLVEALKLLNIAKLKIIDFQKIRSSYNMVLAEQAVNFVNKAISALDDLVYRNIGIARQEEKNMNISSNYSEYLKKDSYGKYEGRFVYNEKRGTSEYSFDSGVITADTLEKCRQSLFDMKNELLKTLDKQLTA